MFEFVLIVVAGAHACTWPAEFAGSVWLDSDRGQVTFTSVSATGWSITAQGDQEVSGWDCYFHNTTGTGYTLAMQAQGTFVIFKTEYRAFACLQLTRVADSTFIYYLMSEEETRLYKDRLYVKVEPNGTQATPSAADVCLAASHAEAPLANEYHLFIKNEAAAADSLRLCPSMFHGQFQYSVSDGGVTSCGGTGSDMSTCSSQYTLEFDYSLCSKIMAYSGSGLVKCVYDLEVGAYTVTMVMNQDPALTTDTERFTCLVSQSAGNGTVFVSLSPGSCMRIQTPFETPVLQTGDTSGYTAVLQMFGDCEPNTTTTTNSSTTTTTSTTTSLPLTTNMATPAAATSESEDQTLVYVLIAVGCLTGGLVTALATIVVCRYCKRTQKPPCQTPDIIIETLPHKTAGYSMMPFSSMQAPRQDTILGDHISEKDVTVFPQTQSIDLTQNISKNMTSTSLVSQSGHTSNNVLSTVPERAQMVTRQFSAGHLKSRVNVPSWRLVSDSSATLQPVIPPANRGSPDSDQDYVFASTPKAQAHVVRQNSYSGETTRQFTNKVNPNRESVSRDHSLKREKTTTITVPTLDGIIMDDTVNFALRYSSRMMTCKREFEEGKFKSNRSNLSERVVQIATTDPPSRQNSMLGRRCSEPAILARADSFYGTQMAPIQSTASNDHKAARRALTAKTGRSATFFIGASKPQPTLINSFEQADVFHPETSSVRVSPVSEASLPVSPEARNTPQITHQQTDHLL